MLRTAAHRTGATSVLTRGLRARTGAIKSVGLVVTAREMPVRTVSVWAQQYGPGFNRTGLPIGDLAARQEAPPFSPVEPRVRSIHTDGEEEKRVVNIGSVGSSPWLCIKIHNTHKMGKWAKRREDKGGGFFGKRDHHCSDSESDGYMRRHRHRHGKRPENVEINIPLGLLNIGLKMGKSLGVKDLAGVDLKQVKDALDSLSQSEMEKMGIEGGKLVDIDADGARVEVFLRTPGN